MPNRSTDQQRQVHFVGSAADADNVQQEPSVDMDPVASPSRGHFSVELVPDADPSAALIDFGARLEVTPVPSAANSFLARSDRTPLAAQQYPQGRRATTRPAPLASPLVTGANRNFSGTSATSAMSSIATTISTTGSATTSNLGNSANIGVTFILPADGSEEEAISQQPPEFSVPHVFHHNENSTSNVFTVSNTSRTDYGLSGSSASGVLNAASAPRTMNLPVVLESSDSLDNGAAQHATEGLTPQQLGEHLRSCVSRPTAPPLHHRSPLAEQHLTDSSCGSSQSAISVSTRDDLSKTISSVGASSASN